MYIDFFNWVIKENSVCYIVFLKGWIVFIGLCEICFKCRDLDFDSLNYLKSNIKVCVYLLIDKFYILMLVYNMINFG